MLTAEENQLLTRTGPGTPMGSLLREYWIPALLSSELPAADCAPVRVMLLCERLIALRDSSGRVGILAEACPHRGASLFFANNSDGGIRCAYHGRKFDITGRCLEVPCEPPGKAAHVHAKAYRCQERGGVVWVYLGSRATPPPLPALPTNMAPGSERLSSAMLVECNWLQNVEADLDFFHTRALHRGLRALGKAVEGRNPATRHHIEWIDRTPASQLQVIDSPAGCTYAVCEEIEPGGALCWGIGQFIFPFYAMLPQGALGTHWVVARVPMDDRHTMTFLMPSASSAVAQSAVEGCLPHTSDWFGRFRLAQSMANDFDLDREEQKKPKGLSAGSGVPGQAAQDAAIACSMGEIADRSLEHLDVGDLAIVQARRRLLAAVRALHDHGTPPPGVDEPDAYRVPQGSVVLLRGVNWTEKVMSTFWKNNGSAAKGTEMKPTAPAPAPVPTAAATKEESVRAANQILERISQFWMGRALLAAANLGIADKLGTEPRHVNEIAADLSLDADSLLRLMRSLASTDVFREQRSGVFVHTPLSLTLRADAPQGMRDLLRSFGFRSTLEAFARLEDTVRTGNSAFDSQSGGIFEQLSGRPADAAVYNMAMASGTAAQCASINAVTDFARFARIADVGGGTGTLLCSILRKNSTQHGILFDLPHVVAAAPETLERYQVADRCELMGGDFRQALPGGCDAYLLKNVLHGMDDEDAAKLLTRLRESMAANARVFIIEMLNTESGQASTAKAFDIFMLLGGRGARVRTAAAFQALLQRAGFELERLVPTPAGVVVIEGRTAAVSSGAHTSQPVRGSFWHRSGERPGAATTSPAPLRAATL